MTGSNSSLFSGYRRARLRSSSFCLVSFNPFLFLSSLYLSSLFILYIVVTHKMLRTIASTVPRRLLAARPEITSLNIRTISFTAHRMSPLKPLDHPISRPLPSDSFQLLPESQKAGAAEDALYEQQLKDVEAWWASPRYDGIKRPYSAADVVSKRGTQQQSYPSSVMARKLFNLIKEREAKGLPIHTSTTPPSTTINDCASSDFA